MGCISQGVSATLTRLTKTQHPRGSFLPLRPPWSFLLSLWQLPRFPPERLLKDLGASLLWLQAPGPGWGCPSGC